MRKLSTFIRMGIIDAFEYRLDVLGFVASGIARPVVSLAVWLIILASPNTVPAVRGQLIQYYLLLLLVSSFVSAWGAPFISRDIRLGKISPILLKPISFLLPQVGNNIGEKIIKICYLLPVILSLFLLLNQRPNVPSPDRLVLSIIALCGAAVLNFLINTCIGLIAFWTDEASSLDDFMDLLLYFFSGRLFPLYFLPIILQKIAVFLPFRYTLSLPLEIFLGNLSWANSLQGLVWQSFWLAAFIGLYRFMWSRGTKRYSAVGA